MVWEFFKRFARGGESGRGSYDPALEEPVLRIGTCTGEKVAGFASLKNGHFREVRLLRSDRDFDRFCRDYGIDKNSVKTVTAG